MTQNREDIFAARAAGWDSGFHVTMTDDFMATLRQQVHLDSKERVMDFGCGTGLVGLQIAPYAGQMVMVDNSPAMIENLKVNIENSGVENVQILLGQIEDYTGQPVDMIVSFMAMHHIEDTVGMLRQMKTKMKSGGELIIGDLVTEDGSFHELNAVPHNGFDPSQMKEMAEEAGFEAVRTIVYDSVEKNGRQYHVFMLLATRP